MNHKWNKDNVCIKCGIVRERKEYKRWQRVQGVLIHGVWEDKHFYTYGVAWHYGPEHKFDRPECNVVNLKQVVRKYLKDKSNDS